MLLQEKNKLILEQVKNAVVLITITIVIILSSAFNANAQEELDKKMLKDLKKELKNLLKNPSEYHYGLIIPLEEAKDQNAKDRKEISTLKRKVQSLQKELKAQTSNLSTQEGELDEIKTSLAGKDQKIANLSSENRTLRQKIQSLESQMAAKPEKDDGDDDNGEGGYDLFPMGGGFMMGGGYPTPYSQQNYLQFPGWTANYGGYPMGNGAPNYFGEVLFKVQMGAFRDDRELSRYLCDLNLSSGLEIVREGGYCSVTLGSFTYYKDADEFKKRLRTMGFRDAWIVPYRFGRRISMEEALSLIRYY